MPFFSSPITERAEELAGARGAGQWVGDGGRREQREHQRARPHPWAPAVWPEMARGTSAMDNGGSHPCGPAAVVCSGGRGWKKGVRKAMLAEEGGDSDISARRSRRQPGHVCGGRGERLHGGSGIAGGSRLG
jgi:hypothetical protein